MNEKTKVCSKKDCVHCGKPQPLSNFSKCSKNKDGLKNICKDCVQKYYQKYYQKNQNDMKKRSRNYKLKHPEKRKEWYQKHPNYNKEYYNNHLEHIKNSKKEYMNQPANYITFYDQLYQYDSCQQDPKHPELLQVACKYCGRWFNPTNQAVLSRLYSINNNIQPRIGDCNLYCSESCKHACPSYGQKLYPKDFKQNTSREVQPELRKMVLERDNWTCQRCGDNKEDNPEAILHCHHIFPLNEDPICSADVDNCETLCEECHKWVHMNVPGCSYAEMKCSNK